MIFESPSASPTQAEQSPLPPGIIPATSSPLTATLNGVWLTCALLTWCLAALLTRFTLDRIHKTGSDPGTAARRGSLHTRIPDHESMTRRQR